VGWTHIEVRYMGTLTPEERAEIELEENEQRKPLTAAERSRKLVGDADHTAEVLWQRAKAPAMETPGEEEVDEEEPGEFSPIAGENLGGRPPLPDSGRLVAEVLGAPGASAGKCTVRGMTDWRTVPSVVKTAT
jgi:hypothetical protein